MAVVFEAEAFAVHFQDVDVVGQPMEKRACLAFGFESAGPFIVRRIGAFRGKTYS